MTDKQIIIDGVDVSGCPNFTHNKREPNESLCITEQLSMCVINKDCLYKKWKRKEQECEELNKWLPIVTRLEEQFKSHEKAKGISCKTYAEQVFTELDQLKAELQEIREEFGIETLYWKDPNERPHRTHRSLKFLKLKQALTEIKEIAEKLKNFYEELGKCECLTVAQLKQILQKCEVLDV